MKLNPAGRIFKSLISLSALIFLSVDWTAQTSPPPSAPFDFDGDGKIDHSVFRPSDGTWRVRLSSTGATAVQHYGISTDIPVPMAFFQ